MAAICSRPPGQPQHEATPDTASLLPISSGIMGSSKGDQADEQQLFLLLILLFLLGKSHKALAGAPGLNATLPALSARPGCGARCLHEPSHDPAKGDSASCWQLCGPQGWLPPAPYQQLHQGLNHGHQAKAQGNEWAQTSACSDRKASARPASHPRGEQLGPWGAVTAWSLS